LQNYLAWIILFSSSVSWGHGGVVHDNVKHQDKEVHIEPSVKEKYQKINKNYLTSVKPLFQRACMDCHGSNTEFPWYYAIPGVKQLIDNDIKEAKKHLDFSVDFPFKSHETPRKDLDAIESSLKQETMPPIQYRLLHKKSELTKKDILKINEWIQNSKEILK
jgi:hypothetical protein